MAAPHLMKRLLRIFLIALPLSIAVLITIPYLFRDEIVGFVKSQINTTVTSATVDFGDASLSLLRSFPNFHLSITDLSVVGKGNFDGIPLITAKKIGITLDLWSVLSSSEPISISGLSFVEPKMNILITPDGLANYDIIESAEDTSSMQPEPEDAPSDWEVDLKEYSIEQAVLSYSDQSTGTTLMISDLDHAGTARLGRDIYSLSTSTSIASLTTAYGGITWLSKAAISLDADVEANLSTMTFTLTDNQLRINDLLLIAEGAIMVKDDNWNRIGMDLSLKAPQNDFRDLLSLVPGAYIEGYEDVKASGRFDLSAGLNGVYDGVSGTLPPYRIDLTVQNGAFQYPDLPVGINNILIDMSLSAPDSDPDHLVTEVRNISMAIGGQPIKGSFFLTHPLSDPALQATLNGKLDLKQLSEAFPMDGIEQLSGQLSADIRMDARLSDVEQRAVDRIIFEGAIEASDIVYQQTGLPAIGIQTAQVTASPQYLDIPAFKATLGSSPVDASARIDNLLAWLTPDKTMTGWVKAYSPNLNIDQWIPEVDEPDSFNDSTDLYKAATNEEGQFDRFDFDCDLRADVIGYEQYDIRDVAIKGSISPTLLQLDEGTLRIEGSDFRAAGSLVNWWPFVFDGAQLSGRVDLESEVINLNPFMTDDSAAAATETPGGEAPMTPIIIPDNIDLKVRATAGKVVYTDIVLETVTAELTVADAEARISTAKARAFGGTMIMSGGYDTKNPVSPHFDFSYEVEALDFGQTFSTLNTFERLAPIGTAISGTFTSSFSMDGVLGPDFMPDFTTLNMSGFIQTINGVIENFGPLNTISDKLQLDLTNSFPLEDTKNWFNVQDGRLTVQPFDWNIKNIAMTINGWHSIAGEGMDYRIQAAVPRAMIKNSAPGEIALSGLDWASTQAGALGIDIGRAETFNFEIGITGTLQSPDITVKLLKPGGAASVGETLKQQAGEALKDVASEAQERLETEAEALKVRAQQEADSLKTLARQRIDTVARQVTAEAKEKLDSLKQQGEKELKKKLEEQAKQRLDSLLKNKKETVEDKLKKLNPLKKKQ